eukprot:4944440-Amphidinium_carterae.1
MKLSTARSSIVTPLHGQRHFRTQDASANNKRDTKEPHRGVPTCARACASVKAEHVEHMLGQSTTP